MKYVGVDIGGTNLKAGLVDENGNLLATQKMKVASIVDREGLAWTVASLAQELAGAAGVPLGEVASVGVGVPGTVDIRAGSIAYTCNLPLRDVPLRKLFHKYLNIPLYIENDANCAALGEAYAGCGNGAKDFVAVTLGTGVGSGVIIGGKIVNGVNYAGGECGHMVIVVDGEQCSCGRKGCWEAYASATALIRQTKKAMEEYPDSLMHKLAKEEGKVSGRTAFDAMRLGDIAGIKVVDDYIKYVACGLINIVNALQPEIICIGGGICNEGETLMKPLRRFVQSERYSIHSKIQTKIVKAELGNDAGVIGAALLGKVK